MLIFYKLLLKLALSRCNLRVSTKSVEKSQNHLEAAFAVEGVQAIYFLSDGEDYDNSGRLLARVNLLSQNKRVHLHTTAFYASSTGQQTMKALAEATGGTYLNYGDEDDSSP